MTAERAVEAALPSAPSARLARDLVALCKPRITLMVTATGVAGALVARERPALGGWVGATLGTAAIVAGANTLNMWLERESDARMERTRDRPLAAGRISARTGLLFGVALSALSIPLLLAANRLVAALGLVALVTYVAMYTPMKRFTAWSLPVGAIAGAMPPAMGYAAATGTLDARGAFLFAVLFAWQLPHFMAISIVRADEYAAAGLSVGAAGARLSVNKIAMVVTAVLLLATTLAAPLVGLGGRWSQIASAITGLAMVALSLRAARAGAGRSEARDAFAFTMAHLAIVLTALGVDR